MNNENKETSIELLAPAKNYQMGKLAITCGADAVYIGSEKFGARAKVGNSIEDIEKLIDFAKQYYAKVYVTINTLLFDDEIEDAVKMIHQLNKIGVDGIIIQDMGILEYELPSIPIIASTQCFCNTPEKAKFFQDLGFKRIILPRELNLLQINEIHKAAPKIELEFFIHGSLCVSYSGQCYMSYSIGGRSGNRGVCAQPCRKIYTVTDFDDNIIEKNKHILSLKDLNNSKHLEELINSGISSFKIEGRLKDESYIKNIVPFYRQKIDEILLEKNLTTNSSGKTYFAFSSDPDKTFNRNFTDYFITGKQHNITSIHTPKMQGEYVGKIQKAIKQVFFLLDNETKLSSGDGICFFINGKLQGANINKMVGEKIYPNSMNNIKAGLEIYRNHDHEYLKKLKSQKIARKIEIEIALTELKNGFRLIAIDEDNNQVKYDFQSENEFAENSEMAKKNIIKNLQKTGNTIFNCKNVTINLKKMIFLKKSQINELRRELLNRLQEKRIKNKPVSEGKILLSNIKYVTDKLDYTGNVINEKAAQFYRRHGVKEIESGPETGLDMTGKKVMTTKYCFREEKDQCLKKISHSGNPDWKLIDEKGNQFRLKFRCDVCEMDIIKENHSELL